jgi:hypothetical protein
MKIRETTVYKFEKKWVNSNDIETIDLDEVHFQIYPHDKDGYRLNVALMIACPGEWLNSISGGKDICPHADFRCIYIAKTKEVLHGH